MRNNLAIYGGFAGTETTLSQRNTAANPSILSGNIGNASLSSDNTYNIVTSPGTNNTSRIDGFTITGANANGGGTFDTDRGGGIHIGNDASPIIANCIISGNNAQFGGGIYVKRYTSPTIINCLISGNTAIYDGGGIANETNGFYTLINSTIAGNSKRGIMHYGSTAVLKNSIVWGNQYEIYGYATVSNSIIQGGAYNSAGNLNTDPLFINPLAPGLNTGGNYGLQAATIALNAGLNDAYTNAGGVLSTLDIAGNPRLFGDQVDMGAFEAQNNTTNDNCIDAIALVCGQPISGNTFGATPSGMSTLCGPYASADARDVWYSFVADGSLSYTITVSSSANEWDGVLFLYSGDCNNLVYQECADAAVPFYGGTESITPDILAAGTYYIRTLGFFEASTYTIELTCEPADCPLLGLDIGNACDDGNPNTINDQVSSNCECEGHLPNDDCSGAIALECGQPISGDTFDATASGVDTECGYNSPYGYDVWYSFVADGTSNYTVLVSTTSPNWDGVLFLYSGDCNNLLSEACSDNTVNGGAETITLTTPAAGTYYVRTYDYFGSEAYTIELTCVCPLLGLNVGSPCDDGNPATINDTVNANCECLGVPVNDHCDGAIALECGLPVSGNTVGASSSGLDSYCGFTASSALDVWYSFVADGTLSYTVSVVATASDWDGVIFLYSGDCNNLVYQACTDASVLSTIWVYPPLPLSSLANLSIALFSISILEIPAMTETLLRFTTRLPLPANAQDYCHRNVKTQ